MSEIADETLFEKNNIAMECILEEINKAMQKAIETGNTELFNIIDILTTGSEVTITIGLDMDTITISKEEKISKEDVSIIKKLIKIFSELPPLQIPRTIKQVDSLPENLEEISEALETDVEESNIPDDEKGQTISSIEKLTGGARRLFGEIAKTIVEYSKKKAESKEAEKIKIAEKIKEENPEVFKPIDIPENIKLITAAAIANIVYAIYIPRTDRNSELIDIVTLESLKNNTQDLMGVRSLVSGKIVDYKSDVKRVLLHLGDKNIDTHIHNILRLFDINTDTLTDIIEPIKTIEEIQIAGGPFDFTFNNIICKNKPIFDNLEIIETIGDGTCLIHSFLQSTSELYRKIDRLNKFRAAKVFRLGIVTQIVKKSDSINKDRIISELLDTNKFLDSEVYEILANHYKYNFIMFSESEIYNTILEPYRSIANPNRDNFIMFYNKDPLHFSSLAKKEGEIYNFQIKISEEAINKIDVTPIDKCTSKHKNLLQVKYQDKPYYIYKKGFKGDLIDCNTNECNAAILLGIDSDGKSMLKLKDGKIDIILLSDLNYTGIEAEAPAIINPAEVAIVLDEEDLDKLEGKTESEAKTDLKGLLEEALDHSIENTGTGILSSKSVAAPSYRKLEGIVPSPISKTETDIPSSKEIKTESVIPSIESIATSQSAIPKEIAMPVAPINARLKNKNKSESVKPPPIPIGEELELLESPEQIFGKTNEEKEIVEEEAKLAQYNVEKATEAISKIGSKVAFAPTKPLNPIEFNREYLQLKNKYLALRLAASQKYGISSEQYKTFNDFINKLDSLKAAFNSKSAKDTSKHKKQEEMQKLYIKFRPKK